MGSRFVNGCYYPKYGGYCLDMRDESDRVFWRGHIISMTDDILDKWEICKVPRNCFDNWFDDCYRKLPFMHPDEVEYGF